MTNQPLKELRFYIIHPEILEEDGISLNDLSDEGFITIAEEKGDMYSLKGFMNAFNEGEISDQCYLRIIEF